MFKNNPQFFINSLFFFSSYSFFALEKAGLCWKHYKNSVFRKTQLFKNTVSKTHFFTHVKKNTFLQKKVSFLVLVNFRRNHYFYSFSWFALFLGPKKFLAKTDSVHEMRVFSPFLTQIVSGQFFAKKKKILIFSHFWMTTLKKTLFL